MHKDEVANWIHRALREQLATASNALVDGVIGATWETDSRVLVITDDGERAQTWIISVEEKHYPTDGS